MASQAQTRKEWGKGQRTFRRDRLQHTGWWFAAGHPRSGRLRNCCGNKQADSSNERTLKRHYRREHSPRGEDGPPTIEKPNPQVAHRKHTKLTQPHTEPTEHTKPTPKPNSQELTATPKVANTPQEHPVPGEALPARRGAHGTEAPRGARAAGVDYSGGCAGVSCGAGAAAEIAAQGTGRTKLPCGAVNTAAGTSIAVPSGRASGEVRHGGPGGADEARGAISDALVAGLPADVAVPGCRYPPPHTHTNAQQCHA